MLLCFRRTESAYQGRHLRHPSAPASPSSLSCVCFCGDLHPRYACELSTHKLNASEQTQWTDYSVKEQVCSLLQSAAYTSDILVLKIILVLVFIQFWVNNF